MKAQLGWTSRIPAFEQPPRLNLKSTRTLRDHASKVAAPCPRRLLIKAFSASGERADIWADDEADPWAEDQLQSSARACCYGCGVSLQTATTAAAGFVDPEKFALKRRHRQLDQLLCARCQDLSNGAMIPGVADFSQLREQQTEELRTGFASARILASPDELREQLLEVRRSRSLVVLLIDLLDASGTALGRVRDLVGSNPIIAIGTKFDLLPKGADAIEVEDWLRRALEFKRVSADSVHIVSSATGEGVSQAVGAVRKARLGRDVYVMGAANVGKSSFVRALVKDMSSISSRQYDPRASGKVKRLPVESAMPGTTLRTIPLKVFSSGGTLYDTPGLHLPHRVPHLLTPDENKQLHPRRRLRAHVPPAPAQIIAQKAPSEASGSAGGVAFAEEGEGELAMATYWWGSLARIDVLSCPADVALVFHGPAVLRVSAVPGGQRPADGGQVVTFGAASVAARGGLKVARSVEVDVDDVDERGAIADVAISGVPGWATLVAGAPMRRRRGGGGRPEAVRLRVWAPPGVQVFVRPPLPVPVELPASAVARL